MREMTGKEKFELWDKVLKDDTIKYQEHSVYTYLWKYCNINTGYANPSRERIFKELGISNKTFDRLLKKLIDKGYIKTKKGHKNETTRYYLTLPTESTTPVEDFDNIEEITETTETYDDYDWEQIQEMRKLGLIK